MRSAAADDVAIQSSDSLSFATSALAVVFCPIPALAKKIVIAQCCRRRMRLRYMPPSTGAQACIRSPQ
jgi:hypothetical protein